MQDSVSVAANSVSTNQLTGQMYEVVARGTPVILAVAGSLTGLRVSFTCTIPLILDQAMNLQNRFPLIPDDIMYRGRVPGGRMILTFRNTTAGAITAFWRVDVA